MRSICCWGAGSSSMKPERVRGVIFAMRTISFVLITLIIAYLRKK